MAYKDFCSEIKHILNNRRPRRIRKDPSRHRRAAILIPIFKMDDEYRILFTKRAPHLKYHQGHISFPGGVLECADQNPLDAALRETYEEIGILRKDIEILGPVDDSETIFPPFIIHCFVGHFPFPYEFNINPQEVEKILDIPLSFFFQHRSTEDMENQDFYGNLYYPEYHISDETIWGTTASIVNNFIGILKGKLRPPDKFLQPAAIDE